MPFSYDALQRRLVGLPMVSIVPFFALGILLQYHLVLNPWWLLALFVLCGLGAVWCASTACRMLFLVVAGYLVAELQPRPKQIPTDRSLEIELQLTDDGMRRGDRLRYEAEILRWQEPRTKAWQGAVGRVWLYADTTQQLAGGDRLLLRKRIYPFRDDSTSYGRLMQLRGYRGRCYLAPNEELLAESTERADLHLRASRLMRRRLSEQSDRAAVVQAMTVGDRSGIGSELREAYARSGMSHLLALSGLHTGLLFLLCNLALGWLGLIHHGHRVKNLLVIVAVWLFVAAADFPPSAVRAAVMCTILQWARFSSSYYRTLNGWAAAALLLLAWHPYYLFDIGFQLSFLAVAGILFVAVPLGACLRTRYGAVNWLLDMLLVSFAATLLTLPLSAYRFGIVPWLGVWCSPLAVLLGMGVVALGLVVLLLPPLVTLVRPLLLQVAEWQNALAEWVASIEGAVSELTPSIGTVWAFYLFFLLLLVGMWSWDRKKSVHL